MDCLSERNMIIGNLETLLSFNKENKTIANQDSLFGSIGGIETKLTLKEQPEALKKDKLAWEKELLGLYISGHPLDEYKEKIQKLATEIKKIKNEVKNNMQVTVVGIIDDVRMVMTKKNDRMAFIKLSDYTG